MNDYKSFVCATLDGYKCKSKTDEYRTIPMYDGDALVAFLKPVTYLYKQIRPKYIDLICKWRSENPEGFANVFENTHAKTENWLDNVLLPRQDRILFMIHSLDNQPIAHIGLSSFDFNKKSCEIDNVVRGVKEGNPGIMSLATSVIIQWAINTLKVKSIYLRVLSDNNHAINFYEKNGFVKQFDIPLYKLVKPYITEWIELKDTQGKKPDRYYTYMKYNGK